MRKVIWILGLFFFCTSLMLSCHKDNLRWVDFVGNYEGSSGNGGFVQQFVIEKGVNENELLLHGVQNAGGDVPLVTAQIISETEFAIPDHIYAHYPDSPGLGCMICPQYPPYLVKYNGYGKINQSDLSIMVNTYYKYPDDDDFVLFKNMTMTLVKQ